MKAEHFEFVVEEPSMEVFLEGILPRLLGEKATFKIHAHQGKSDLFRKLDNRLRGYSRWLPLNWRIVILVDCDASNCLVLKIN